MKPAIVSLLPAILAGCLMIAPESLSRGYARLRLNGPLMLQPGRTRAAFQAGRPVEGRQITVWLPVCALVFTPASDTGRKVAPAEWRIAGVRQDYDVGGWMRGVTVYRTLFLLEGGGDGPDRLECEVWRSPEQPQRPLDDVDIRAAIGDRLQLR